MKYQLLTRKQYFEYHGKAYQILSQIGKDKEAICYQDIIRYFEQHYPVILPAGFSVEQRGLPDGGNMIEKELIVK